MINKKISKCIGVIALLLSSVSFFSLFSFGTDDDGSNTGAGYINDQCVGVTNEGGTYVVTNYPGCRYVTQDATGCNGPICP